MSQTKMRIEKYRLYAALLNEKTMRIAIETPYARISKNYALIYKRGNAPEGYKEIPEKAMPLLTQEEKQWLQETNVAVMTAFAEKHQKAQKRGIRKFAARFEEELRAERKKMEDEHHAAETGD